MTCSNMARCHRIWRLALGMVLLLATAAGCGDDTVADKDSGGAADTTVDTGGVLADTGVEVSEDTADTGSDSGELCPGAAGCPCGEHSECDSAMCIETPDGKQCARTCVTDCPEGFRCSLVPVSGGDNANICVPRWGRLCDPCGASKDCAALGLEEPICVDQGAAGAFCGVRCASTADCPTDYTCEEATSIEGTKSKQCVRAKGADGKPGACACSKAAVTQALATTCWIESKDDKGEVIGKCGGKRTCTEQGLSGCQAPPPTSEICNGSDDDCDGKTDEAGCDDNNACTSDSCAAVGGKLECTYLPTEGPCDADGSVCTEGDACKDGLCVAGKAKVCDDKNPCTKDACDAAAGCTQTADDGAPCSDDNPCTIGDACKGSGCQAGGPKVCDSGDPCVDSKCKLGDGSCQFTDRPDGFPCSDGTVCTNGDGCKGGSCVGKAVDCDDKNPCTDDSCDLAKGCTATANTSPCDDGQGCTVSDTCQGGACVGSAKVCDDKNVCTSDSCDSKTGSCVTLPLVATQSCDDGDPCTLGDICASGACGGKAKACDDSDPCTVDACNGKTGACEAKPGNDGAACSDGKHCTDKDTCANGACKAGPPTQCDDADPCTVDACDEAAGGCTKKAAADATACNDGDACTLDDGCVGGVCKAGNPKDCDDKEQCTGDSCDPKSGKCFHVAKANDTPCTDGDGCTLSDVCAGGTCKAGAAKVCDDQEQCTDDSCDKAKGECVFAAKNDGVVCNDNDPCTLGDACGSGTCKAGAAKDCNDDEQCTDDSCEAASGKCVHKAKADATPCQDGSACTLDDGCAGGVCKPGAAKVCEDGKFCTKDGCNAANGDCTFTNLSDGTGCDDGKGCTVSDVCQGGACGGKDKVCDDNNACTTDSCDAASGNCKATPVVDGGSCEDGDKCTLDDACKSGSCLTGKAKVCEDGKSCTQDGCDAASGNCSFKPASKGTPCDDGKPCTTGDACDQGVCAGADKTCDDKNPCTKDSCNALNGQCINAPQPDGTSCAKGATCDAGKCVPSALAPSLQIVAGTYHTCALTATGTVSCWGYNVQGQLGNGTTTTSNVPVQVKGVASVGNLCAGGDFACAVLTDGTARCWGGNAEGQLGDGTKVQSSTAVTVKGLSKAAAITCGANFACARRGDGSVHCWGNNTYGQLGDDTKTTRTLAAPVVSLADAVDLAAGNVHVCALRKDGYTVCWGYNDSLQLGHTRGTTTIPMLAEGWLQSAAMGTGNSHSCGIGAGGRPWCWGYNGYGTLGNGTTTTSAAATPVGGSSFVNILAIEGGWGHTCGRGKDGKVHCWGYGANGQLGHGKAINAEPQPVLAAGLSHVVSVAAGAYHSCALRADGAAYCWGANDFGQIGNGTSGTNAKVLTPAAVAGSPALPQAGQSCDKDGDCAPSGQPCAPAVCDGTTGKCSTGKAKDGDECDDGDRCTFADACLSGVCEAIGINCDDANPCTIDRCDALSGACVNAPVPGGAVCGDDKVCAKAVCTDAPMTSGWARDLAAGHHHTCALLRDGTVRCWGYNNGGQLGDDSTTNRLTAVAVKGLQGVVEIAAAANNSCARLKDGTVWCWGENGQGQLGDGSKTASKVPVQVKNLSKVKQIAMDEGGSACALLQDGAVKCWGYNANGQLGDGTKTTSTLPVTVKDLGPALAVAAGGQATCALLGSGALRCWGINSNQQQGHTLFSSATTPWLVLAGSQHHAVSVGVNHVCALLPGGLGQCWGYNGYGQFGDGTTTGAATPQPIAGLKGAVALHASSNFTCARDGAGKAWCWGYNAYGQVGDGTTSNASSPKEVKVAGRVHRLATGTYHACAVIDDGSVQCWGYNHYGQHGNGAATGSAANTKPTLVYGSNAAPYGGQSCASAHECAEDGLACTVASCDAGTGQCQHVAVKDGMACDDGDACSGSDACASGKCAGKPAVSCDDGNVCTVDSCSMTLGVCIAPALPGGAKCADDKVCLQGTCSASPAGWAKALTAGGNHTCALRHDGKVSCWGYNANGQLGDGTIAAATTPREVLNLDKVEELDAGENHTCARRDDGSVWCWGNNGDGQVGNGAKSSRQDIPVEVKNLGGKAVQLALGSAHSCARLLDGTARCWGANGQGQFGTGTTTGSTLPVALPTPTGLGMLTSGAAHACALKGDGYGWCWGGNGGYQLGTSLFASTTTPWQVEGLTQAQAITGGGSHTCAIRGGGQAVCWGYNGYGNLGDGSTTQSAKPVTVTGGATWRKVEAGFYHHSCGLQAGGKLACWGYNGYGNLGDGTTSHSAAPKIVNVGAKVRDFAVGYYHTCALTDDGRVKCWGHNYYGQLGTGTTTGSAANKLPLDVVDSTKTPFGAAAGAACSTAMDCGEDGDLCTVATCDEGTGTCKQVAAPDGIPCTDGSACTTGEACKSGACSGGKAKVCDDGNPCTIDSCDVASGGCVAAPLPGGGACGDGKACFKGVCSADTPVGWARAVSAGANHTCALRADRSVMCWGYNGYGQLGDGSTTSSSAPLLVPNLSGIHEVAAGSGHTCARDGAGKVWCWGHNAYGQLGDGSTATAKAPVQVKNLAAAARISVASNHSCALVGDKVWCWGYNGNGEIGNGTTTSAHLPVELVGLDQVRDLAAGAGHTCALRASGDLWCWGLNSSNQQGSTLPVGAVLRPTRIESFGGGRALGVQDAATCAIRGDGRAQCWGLNSYGGLGDGTTTSSVTPRTVGNLENLKEIDGGYYASCARDGAGVVSCWGYNGYGGLGEGTKSNSVWPKTVKLPGPARQISVGTYHACALLQDGAVACWGYNHYGQVGYGDSNGGAGVPTPALVLGSALTPWGASVGVGCVNDGDCGEDNSACTHAVCDLGTSQCKQVKAADGLACDDGDSCTSADACKDGVCAGKAKDCGDGNSCTGDTCGAPTGACYLVPPPGSAGCGTGKACAAGTCVGAVQRWATTIAAGNAHSCARRADGTAMCWGYNGYGQLGDGSKVAAILPTAVKDLKDVAALSASSGGNHTCAVLTTGKAMCWGYNGYGQLGDGTKTDRTAVTEVANLSGLVAIAAGDSHTCALHSKGEAWCWGYNTYGQLGDGSKVDRVTAVKVANLPASKEIVASGGSTCALGNDGKVRCWGYNGNGESGHNSGTTSTSPIEVAGLAGATALAAGGNFHCAVASGKVKCWGNNAYYQLGNGTTAASFQPVEAVGVADAVRVSAGTASVCAVRVSGAIECWGYNGYGKLAQGGTSHASVPKATNHPLPVLEAAVGGNHILTLREDGSVWASGYNYYGQLGSGTTTGNGVNATPNRVRDSLATPAGVAPGAACATDFDCAEDGSPCTVSVCDVGTGKCKVGNAPDGLGCSVASPCFANGVCAAGACGAAPLKCDDSACNTIDVCAPQSAMCLAIPTGGPICQ